MDQMMTEEPDEMLAEDPLMALSQDVLVVLILMGITALVGLIGNLIFVRALCMYRNLRVDVFVIMGGLAVADMLHLVIAVPSHMMDILRVVGVMSTPWCKCSRYLMNGTAYIASYHVVVMTVLRGILLTNRGHSSPTGRHALYCSIVVWVVGALATVPVIQVWEHDIDACLYTTDADIDKEIWLTSSFSCFVPITMMLLIYATTYYIGKRYFADSYSRHEKQMSRLVSAVVLSFIICELPHHVTTLVYNSAYDHPDQDYIKNLSVINDYLLCLLLVDKAIRPVLYSKLSTDLGDCFDEVINCTYCHRYYSDGPRRQKSDKSAASTAPSPQNSQQTYPVKKSYKMALRSRVVAVTSSTRPNSGYDVKSGTFNFGYNESEFHELVVIREGKQRHYRSWPLLNELEGSRILMSRVDWSSACIFLDLAAFDMRSY